MGASSSVNNLRKNSASVLDKIVEREQNTNKNKHMNKAEIYQAVRKARLRSNYMNRDLSGSAKNNATIQ